MLNCSETIFLKVLSSVLLSCGIVFNFMYYMEEANFCNKVTVILKCFCFGISHKDYYFSCHCTTDNNYPSVNSTVITGVFASSTEKNKDDSRYAILERKRKISSTCFSFG